MLLVYIYIYNLLLQGACQCVQQIVAVVGLVSMTEGSGGSENTLWDVLAGLLQHHKLMDLLNYFEEAPRGSR